jgi:hypothetical protein
MGLDDAEIWMTTRHGTITRAEALARGLTPRQIDRRVASGRWHRLHPGVYRHAVAAATWESDLLAACLSTGGIASHQSAAVLWDLGIVVPGRPVVSTARRRRRTPKGVIVHQTTQWAKRAETERRGIPVTGLERTLLDCAAVVPLRRLERLCESAIRQRLTSWADLATTLARHSRRGRDGCGRLRTLLELRLGAPDVPLSDFSRLVANLLVDAGIEEPEVEYPVVDRDGGFILQADLAWPRRRKIVELDGLEYHFGRAERERDNRKRNRAKAEGWSVLEVLWSMLVDEPEQLVDVCRRFLAR